LNCSKNHVYKFHYIFKFYQLIMCNRKCFSSLNLSLIASKQVYESQSWGIDNIPSWKRDYNVCDFTKLLWFWTNFKTPILKTDLSDLFGLKSQWFGMKMVRQTKLSWFNTKHCDFRSQRSDKSDFKIGIQAKRLVLNSNLFFSWVHWWDFKSMILWRIQAGYLSRAIS
jgi:hypothetical protein